MKAFEGAPIGVVFARASRLGFVACDLSDDNNLVVKISQNRVSNQTYAIYVNGASCVKVQDNTVFNNNPDTSESHGLILLGGSAHNKLFVQEGRLR